MPDKLYDVFWWDHDSANDRSMVGQWHAHARAIKRWTIRRALRRLYARGFSSVSVLVERCDPADVNWRRTRKRKLAACRSMAC